MKINAPTQLTLLRLFLVPFFLIFTVSDSVYTRVAALIVFVIASLTDLWDGRLARRRGMVTILGTFLDPLADKFLISSAFIAFVQIGDIHVPAWMVVLIIGREFLITGLRTLAVSQGRVLAAQPAGKFKTTSQLVTIITILVILSLHSLVEKLGWVPESGLESISGYQTLFIWILKGLPYWMTFLTAIFTVLSGYIYIRDNLDLFYDQRPAASQG
jgi:CDP-diacylglycerol--glycerol-3-phosphate 3-phosphatidyltransferase